MGIFANADIATEIARRAAARGGRAYYVGGCVRDALRRCGNGEGTRDAAVVGTAEPSAAFDLDLELHGLAPAEVRALLAELGDVQDFGADFGIYQLRGCGVDVALPRREWATGAGHRDFSVEIDPFMGTRTAAQRRDFTVNALMCDVLTGEVIDHFGGLADLRAGVLRHIDAGAFAQDPLRVLRAAQFAARFGFSVAPETAALCAHANLQVLSRQRVEDEMKKALCRAARPSVFFETLREFSQLTDWFCEPEQLIGVLQSPVHHPEGDVWTHTLQVLDRAAACRAEVSDAYAFMLLALTHDFGKIVTTECVNGVIHAYGHETQGLPLVKAFLARLVGDGAVADYVLNMVPLHMKPNLLAAAEAKVKSTNKLFDEAVAPADLICFARCDKPNATAGAGAAAGAGTGDAQAFLRERLAVYRKTMAAPHVSGDDLRAAGLEPGAHFGPLLAYAHKLRLAGVGKEAALRQTLAYAKKLARGN